LLCTKLYITKFFKCSIGVVGIGFFRAILQTCKEKNVSKRHELFTKVANVYYSYRKFPYEGHAVSDYEARVQQNFAAWLSRLGFYEWARSLFLGDSVRLTPIARGSIVGNLGIGATWNE
jgi:hypothetical protein